MCADKPPVAVTGAAGCLGGHLVRRLLERGYRVRGLDRNPSMRVPIESPDFELVCGDVGDGEALRRLCTGAEWVFHTAAIVGDGYPRKAYERINVEGTRRVAEAAVECGIKRLIHVSSVITYGFAYPHQVDESGPLSGTGHPYAASKIEGERVLREALAASSGAAPEFVIVRAGDIYGPHSDLWTIQPLEMMQKRLFFLVGRGVGAMNYVYVENLVDGMLLAAEKAESGDVFNIVDGCVSLREFFGYYARMLGGRRMPSLPVWFFCYLAFWYDLGLKVIGRRSVITPYTARFLLRPGAYSGEKARRVLGYQPARSLEAAMAEIEDWARTTGVIRSTTGRAVPQNAAQM